MKAGECAALPDNYSIFFFRTEVKKKAKRKPFDKRFPFLFYGCMVVMSRDFLIFMLLCFHFFPCDGALVNCPPTIKDVGQHKRNKE